MLPILSLKNFISKGMIIYILYLLPAVSRYNDRNYVGSYTQGDLALPIFDHGLVLICKSAPTTLFQFFVFKYILA